jgi:hypothetical protein
MEINNVTSKAYTSSAAAVDDEEELQEQDEVQTQEEVAKPQKDESDKAEFSTSDLDEADVEEKANNYLQNILFFGNLTDESKAAITNYMNNFDAAELIDMYGPFESTADVSAAMYAATSGMVKQQEA